MAEGLESSAAKRHDGSYSGSRCDGHFRHDGVFSVQGLVAESRQSMVLFPAPAPIACFFNTAVANLVAMMKMMRVMVTMMILIIIVSGPAARYKILLSHARASNVSPAHCTWRLLYWWFLPSQPTRFASLTDPAGLRVRAGVSTRQYQ